MDTSWTVVATFPHRPQADVVASILHGHGLPARVRGDDAGGVAPHLGWITGGIAVEVPTDRADEARELLADEEPDRLLDPDAVAVEMGATADLPGGVGPNTAAYGGGASGAFMLGLAALVKRLRRRRDLERLDD